MYRWKNKCPSVLQAGKSLTGARRWYNWALRDYNAASCGISQRLQKKSRGVQGKKIIIWTTVCSLKKFIYFTWSSLSENLGHSVCISPAGRDFHEETECKNSKLHHVFPSHIELGVQSAGVRQKISFKFFSLIHCNTGIFHHCKFCMLYAFLTKKIITLQTSTKGWIKKLKALDKV